MTQTDIVIIGGGVAGCSLATLLTDRGLSVTLLEKDAIGGLLREIELDSGYYCDSAPHLLFYDNETESHVGDLFSQFTDLTHSEFYAATYPRGELDDPHHYPVSEENIARWEDSEQIRGELEAAPGTSDAAFFEEYMLDQVGPTLYERYYRSYTKQHWGINPTQITGDWFDFKISVPETERDFFGDGAYYPSERYTEILRQMVSDSTVLFEGATELVTEGNRIEAVRTESGREVTGDCYVSTVDPSLLVDGYADLRYRSMIILGVHIEASERPFPPRVDWGYFPNHYEFTRLTAYDFTDQSIPRGEYILSAEFPCFVEDDRWASEDDWFEQYLLEVLKTQGLESETIASQVRREPRAYPLPATEEIETFERINAELSTYENLFNLGRTSTYDYIWIKDIVTQAYDVLDSIEAAIE